MRRGPRREGAVDRAGASVAQAPKNMGALGIDSLVKLKGGGTIEPVIDTGTVLVTKDNAEQYK